MIQLRCLNNVELDKATRIRQANGTILSTYTKVEDYKVSPQELTDEVSAAIYGSDVVRMLRLTSPRRVLEQFLRSKVNNTSDNISLYTIVLDGFRYKIVTVRNNWIDVELIGSDDGIAPPSV